MAIYSTLKNDLPSRLRNEASSVTVASSDGCSPYLCEEAADRIEKLQDALAKIANGDHLGWNVDDDRPVTVQEYALSAIEDAN